MRAGLTTTQRGLGGDHQRIGRVQRRELAANPGRPCPRCGIPMFATVQAAMAAGLPRKLWAVDLDDWPGRVFGGPQIKRLAHAHCNRRAGAIIGNRRRAARRPQRYDRW